MAPDATSSPVARAVLLDALGTLVELELPWPHLRAGLAARGVAVTLDDARRAMRAEMAHYAAHHDRAGTQEALAAFRRECARIVQVELGAPVAGLSEAEVEAVLLDAVRFVAYPDVRPALVALRAAGLRLVVVSNWDVSLHEVLARTGLAELVDGAVSSAEIGSAKPAPAIFARGLELAGARPEEALHAGDALDADVEGAIAAGIAPVLIARPPGAGLGSAAARPGPAPAGVPSLPSLAGLPELVRYRRGEP